MRRVKLTERSSGASDICPPLWLARGHRSRQIHPPGVAFFPPRRYIPPMHWKDIFEFTFYMVDTFALPFAIIVYVIERRKERQADEEELYQRLSDEYMNFGNYIVD